MTANGGEFLRFELLTEAHLGEVMTIELDAYPDPWNEDMFRQEIDSDPSHFYVAFLEDVLVGYGGFWLAVDEAHITSVTVRTGYRRRGFGRRLTLHLLRHALAVDARRAILEVRRSNLVAQALYESLGFKPIGLRKGYYPKTREDAIVMAKDFGPPRSVADLYEEA